MPWRATSAGSPGVKQLPLESAFRAGRFGGEPPHVRPRRMRAEGRASQSHLDCATFRPFGAYVPASNSALSPRHIRSKDGYSPGIRDAFSRFFLGPILDHYIRRRVLLHAKPPDL